MRGRIITIAIGVVSASIGISLVAVAIRLADDVHREQTRATATPVVRPSFALDSPAYVGALPDSIVHRIPNDPSIALARVASAFAIPRSVLATWVDADLNPTIGEHEPALVPLATSVLDALNRPVDDASRAAIGTLAELLGRDPRPLDSHTCRELVLGIAVRGAYLAAQRAAYETHLTSLGLAPHEDTLWFFALLSARRGDRETMACIEEITALGEMRRQRALESLEPTVHALEDKLVLRAFLREWQEREARSRRAEFLEAAVQVMSSLRAG